MGATVEPALKRTDIKKRLNKASQNAAEDTMQLQKLKKINTFKILLYTIFQRIRLSLLLSIVFQKGTGSCLYAHS
jgi:membrane protein insertase Oxa1/YidC/SpoIIIJ